MVMRALLSSPNYCSIAWLQLLLLFILVQLNSSSSAYTNVPQEYTLTNVIVLIRHGDRIQITKDLGNIFHDSKNVTRFWKLKLPNENTLRSLARSAYPYVANNSSFDNLRKRLYSGWDIVHFPYGQLTERGSYQLKHIGRKFWRRYHDFLLDDHSLSSIDTMYCRSTNICRTLLSLRSFLTGFFYKDGSSSLGSRPHSYRPGYSRNRNNAQRHNTVTEATTKKDDKLMKETMDLLQISSWNITKLPIIIARPKSFETMYPGSCDYLAKRRAILIENKYNNATMIPSYFDSLEEKLHRILTIPRPFNWLTWLNVMEILTVMDIHNVTLPDGLDRTDMSLTTELVSWMWGALYKDVDLVKFAIGRFAKEFYDDVRLSVEDLPVPSVGRRTSFFQLSKKRNRAAASKTGQSEMGLTWNADEEEETEESPLLSPLPTVNTKFIVYSGHDATLVPMLVILDIYKDNWPDYGSQLTFEFVLTDDARFEHNQTSQAGHSSASGRSSRASGSNGDSSVVNSGSLNSSSFYSSLSESGTTSVSATIDTYTGTRSSHNSSSSSLKSMLKSISKGIHNQLKIGHSRDSSSTGSSSTGSSSTGSSTVSLSRRFVRVVYNDEPQLVGGKCQGYGYWCPYPLFMDMFGPYLISQDDYIKECKDKAEGVPDIEGSVPASGH